MKKAAETVRRPVIQTRAFKKWQNVKRLCTLTSKNTRLRRSMAFFSTRRSLKQSSAAQDKSNMKKLEMNGYQWRFLEMGSPISSSPWASIPVVMLMTTGWSTGVPP